MTVPPDEDPQQQGLQPGPVQPRIGDAERDRAVGYLQEHMAQGRLDRLEFDDRLTRALNARTAADLQPLFDDLPEPRPNGLAVPPPYSAPPWSSTAGSTAPAPLPPAAPVPARVGMPRGATAVLSAIWPATIILYIVTDFRFWWLFVIAAMVTYFIRRNFGPQDPEHPKSDGPTALDR